MVKKGAIGIIVIAIIIVILGFFSLLYHIINILNYYKGNYILSLYSPAWFFWLREIFGILFCLSVLISGFFIFALKDWARKLFFCLTLIDFISVLASIFIIVTIMPYEKYGVLRIIGGYVIGFSPAFYFITNFFGLFTEYIPFPYFRIVTSSQVYLSIGLAFFILLFLTRHSVKKEFCKEQETKP